MTFIESYSVLFDQRVIDIQSSFAATGQQQNVQTGSGAHQASYLMGTASSFPRDKAARE